MKLLKDLRRTFDLFRLYLENEIDEILSKVYDFWYKETPKECQRIKKNKGKCQNCTCSSKKNKKNL